MKTYPVLRSGFLRQYSSIMQLSPNVTAPTTPTNAVVVKTFRRNLLIYRRPQPQNGLNRRRRANLTVLSLQQNRLSGREGAFTVLFEHGLGAADGLIGAVEQLVDGAEIELPPFAWRQRRGGCQRRHGFGGSCVH